MKNRLMWAEIIGFVTTVVFYFVWTFMYQWIGTFGWLFPVNESLWEHLKVVFMPFLIYSIIELFVVKPSDMMNFLAIKSLSLIAMPLFVIIVFYTYTGIIGRNFMFIDVLIGILALALGFILSSKLLMVDYKIKNKYAPIIIACILFLLFIIFTYATPRINLFLDTLTGTYGRPARIA